MPEALTRHCVVRSTMEDPETLAFHQHLQQTKSVNELSKITNASEIPIVGKILPPIPLPNPAKIFR